MAINTKGKGKKVQLHVLYINPLVNQCYYIGFPLDGAYTQLRIDENCRHYLMN